MADEPVSIDVYYYQNNSERNRRVIGNGVFVGTASTPPELAKLVDRPKGPMGYFVGNENVPSLDEAYERLGAHYDELMERYTFNGNIF